MSAMGCSEFIDQLDAWMEGERGPQARAHTRDCDRCRRFADDLDAIQSAAPALTVADPEPPARIWTALQRQLTEEGLIRPEVIHSELVHTGPNHNHISDSGDEVRLVGASVRAANTGHSWLDGLFTAIPRPALAAAYLILLCALGLGLTAPRGLRTAQSPAFPVSTQLEDAERSAVSSVPTRKSIVSSSLSRNLAIVDNYITLCEKSVREEPNNEVAREYLYQAYQQKVDLLTEITERGDAIQ